MPDRSQMLRRRALTVSAVVTLFATTTVTLPITLPLAAAVDAGRAVVRRRPWMATRILVTAWLFIAAQVLGLAGLAAVWVASGFGRSRAILETASRRVDVVVAILLFQAVQVVFRMRVEIEGTAGPGPAIVLVRHVGLIENLLPDVLVVGPHRLRLRWVLSGRLLNDPLVDVWGHRWPNHFLGGGDDVAAIRALATGLTERDGVVIFPEGTWATPKRRAEILESHRRRDPGLAEQAAALRHVLPPRPAGTLALLAEAAPADVVIVAHAGLEAFTGPHGVWDGEVVGSTAFVRVERFAGDQIPEDDEARLAWLMERWSDVDRWVGARLGTPP